MSEPVPATSRVNEARQQSSAEVVVAIVNGEPITHEQFERDLSRLPPPLRERYRDPVQRERFIEELIERRLLVQAARERGFDRDATLRAKIEDLEERLLVDALQRAVAAETVTGESLRAYYDAHPDEFTEARIRVRQILVRDEAQAVALRAQIEEGADMGALAREHSLDPSARRGGDLGYVEKGRMDPAFEAAAWALAELGDLSPVVRTRYGYHLIQLVERPTSHRRKFDEVEMNLRSRREREAAKEYAKELRESATVEILPEPGEG